MHAAEVTRGLSEGGGRPRRGEAREKEMLSSQDPRRRRSKKKRKKKTKEKKEKKKTLASEEAESLMIFLITPARGERKEGGVDRGRQRGRWMEGWWNQEGGWQCKRGVGCRSKRG